MQQAASSNGLSPSKSMAAAQHLFEGILHIIEQIDSLRNLSGAKRTSRRTMVRNIIEALLLRKERSESQS